ncbi:hypothetical protein G5B46_02350 [Caulobacter sp. 602-2]|uniref:Bacterial HORMA domain-containing protein n=1 Tax=Caulobacter sp. 602-2 TaxID=2710887 RepID=A0A6G4QSC0_9CAUL|nr:hypothetical protein [Caulobacter sp. 602-2]NGM48441.1 hypothetical protein [Caulobacter sp. 602-2]
MSSSYSISESSTFTVTHARHMAAKVATDLKRMQRFYGKPTDERIGQFEAEVVELLKAGYLGTVSYGFKRNDQWIEPTLRYTAKDLLGASSGDDDPGKLRASANIEGATFHSYLTYSAAYHALTSAQQTAFEACLPFSRSNATEPSINGYLIDDRTYSSGGRALNRSSVRSYS